MSESKPWMNAIAADIFATLRTRYLAGTVGENVIANARELLTLAHDWSDSEASDAAQAAKQQVVRR